jgi:hypothetical protein
MRKFLREVSIHCNLANSALASFKIGISTSASFQSVTVQRPPDHLPRLVVEGPATVVTPSAATKARRVAAEGRGYGDQLRSDLLEGAED